MTQVLTFSELMNRSFQLTKSLLRTFVVGSLILMAISFVFRFLGGGLLTLSDSAPVSKNVGLLVSLSLMGIASTVVGAVVQVLQNVYGLVLAIDRKTDVQAGIKKAWKSLWKLILGGIWIAIRSFGWIAVIGIPFIAFGLETHQSGLTVVGVILMVAGFVAVFILGPRLAFTNIIQLKDGSGVRASANASIKRAQGYWGKIVGNSFLMSLLVMLTSIAFFAVMGLIGVAVVFFLGQVRSSVLNLTIGLPLGFIAIIASVVYISGVTLFSRIFIVELHETILANPRSTKA